MHLLPQVQCGLTYFRVWLQVTHMGKCFYLSELPASQCKRGTEWKFFPSLYTVLHSSELPSDGKASASNAGDPGSIPWSGRSPGEGNGTPLPYSCLENPMNREAWYTTVHGISKSRMRLSDFNSLHFTYTLINIWTNKSVLSITFYSMTRFLNSLFSPAKCLAF